MKATKIISLLLCLVMLSSSFLFACAKEEGPGKGDGIDVVQETKVDQSEVYDAEVHDMHGHEFWFIVRETNVSHLSVNEVYAEELTSDKINDAVFKRNATLEEKYNCKIREERNTDPTSAVREQLIAGEYQYDYIYNSVVHNRSLSASNLLVDFWSLDNIDLSKAWWDMNAIDGLSIAGKAYYVTGDAGTMDERGSWIIYANKDIISRARLDDPYTLVKEGKWTVQAMYEYMEATREDLNGDGVWTVGTDRFGYIGENRNNWYHMAACDLMITEKSSTGDIMIPATLSDEVLAAWAALKPILATEYRDVSDSGGRFRNGLGTFFGCNLGALTTGSYASINTGILPMPKLNEEQEEYWTAPHETITFVYSIPVTTDNATDAEANGFSSGREQAAYFLEAFGYYSRQTLTVAFYDQVLMRQLVQDADTAEMLQIAMKNKKYDAAVIFNFGQIGVSLFSQVGSNTNGVEGKGTDVNYDNLVSVYESRVEAARKALKSYIEYISVD